MPGQSVFISATTKGLGIWRERIAQILENHQIIPSFQVDFTPESIEVKDEIRRLIRESSGVVCLVGPYYGCPFPIRCDPKTPKNAPIPSYTQYEWQLAMTWGKPIKTYIITDKFFDDKIESEVSDQCDSSLSFRDWQRDFQKHVKVGPHLTIRSELDLALNLANTDWEGWIR